MTPPMRPDQTADPSDDRIGTMLAAIDTPEPVYTPYREVTVAGRTLTGMDADITVSHGRRGLHTFDVSLWNLREATWATIREGDPLTIRLGWKDGPILPAIRGTIARTRTSALGVDRRFTLRGYADATRALTQSHSRSWNGQKPAAIIRDICSMAGLTPGQLGDAPPIPGYWAVNADRPLRYWLDRLAEEAARHTGDQWHWYTHDRTRLSFHRRGADTPEVVRLEQGDSLIRITPTAGQTTKDDPTHEREFLAHLEPAIAKDRTVVVADPDGDQPHKVVSYQMRSSSRGHHHVSGVLVSAGAHFPAHFPGRTHPHDIREYPDPQPPAYEEPLATEVPTDPDDAI